MTTTWIRHLSVKPCRSVWAFKNSAVPPQQQLIVDFVNAYQVQDRLITRQVPVRSHEMISVVVDGIDMMSIQDLDWLLLASLSKSTRYLHLCVNKFLLYTNKDQQLYTDSEGFDQRLISHWFDLVSRPLILCDFHEQDRGDLGNFEYPVTQLVWATNA